MALTSQLLGALLQVDGRANEGGILEITPGARLLLDVLVEGTEDGALLEDIATAVAEAKAARDQAEAAVGLTGEDAAIANRITTPGTLTQTALSATYAARSGPLLMSTPTTATLVNQANLLPATGGYIRIEEKVVMDDVFETDAPVALVGNGHGASIIEVPGGGADETLFRMYGGPGQAIRDLTYINGIGGVRTTDDFEFINPWYLQMQNVELRLSQLARTKGGISISADAGAVGAGQGFQTQLHNVWTRNGRIKISGVSDGKITGGYTWGTYTEAAGAIEFGPGAGGWNVVNHDVVPSNNAGVLVSGGITFLTITGGQFDGSYAGIVTGPGFKVADTGGAYIRGLSILGTQMYNHSGTTLDLYEVRGAIIKGLIRDGNKGDSAATEVRVRASQKIHLECYHKMTAARTSPGLLLSEDASSGFNTYDMRQVEDVDGAYLSPFVTIQPSSRVIA